MPVEVGDGSGDSNRKAGGEDEGLDEPTDENDEKGKFFKQPAHTKVRASNSVLKVKRGGAWTGKVVREG